MQEQEKKELKICAIATNPMCARAIRRSLKDITEDCLYISALNYCRGTAQLGGVVIDESQVGYPKHFSFFLPTVQHDLVGLSLENKHDFSIEKNVSSSVKVMADSIGAVEYAINNNLRFDIGPHVPVLNHLSADYFEQLGAECIWLSPELSLKQIKDIIDKTHYISYGLTIIGRQELMITEHCELMSKDFIVSKNKKNQSCKGAEQIGQCSQKCPTCNRRKKPHYLVDRKGYEFPVVTDFLGRSHIFNSVQLDVCHALPQLIDAGITRFMLDSTLLNVEQTSQALGRIKSAVSNYLVEPNNPKTVEKPKNTTTGHLFREIF